MKVLEFLNAPVPPKARLFVISGAESFLRDQAVEHIREALPPEVELSLLRAATTVDREGIGLSDLLDDLRTASLFGGERLLLVKNADELVKAHSKALQRFIEAGEAAHRLLLEGEALAPKTMKAPPKSGLLGAVAAAGGVIVSCAGLYDTNFGGRGPAWDSPLSRWVQRQARTLGRTMSLEDAYALHRAVGSDLRKLDAELQKLAMFAGDRSALTGADVERVVAGSRTTPLYELGEAVASGNAPAALELSARVFGRGATDASGRSVRDPASLSAMLVRSVGGRLEKVFRGRELLDGGTGFPEVAAALAVPPWGRDRFRDQIEAWKDPAARRRALSALRDLERGLKSGGGPPRVLFDRFLVEGLTTAEQRKGRRAWAR